MSLKKVLIFISLLFILFYSFSEEKILIYSYGSNVGELNPHMYSPNQMFGQAMVYEPLVQYDKTGNVIPCLAEGWTISKDGKKYVFNLRKNVLFSDGTVFNAEAVKKNFDAILANTGRHTWLELINQIESVKVVSDYQIEINLKNTYYPFLQELTVCRPVRFLSPSGFPDDGLTVKGIKKAVGTGPWILTETKMGEYNVFMRNEKYWGKKPSIKKIIVKVIPDPDMKLVALETGEINFIYGTGGSTGGQIGFEAFKQIEKNKNFIAKSTPMPLTRMLALNTANGVTKEIMVRKAILYSVNKDVLLKGIFLGLEKKADYIFEPSLPYCNIKLAPYNYDVNLAKKILEESGWKISKEKTYREKNGVLLETTLCYVGNDAMEKAISEYIQAELKKIGIKINLIGEESDSFYNRQKNGEFGMIFNATWGTPYDPHSFVSSMRAPSHADYQAQKGLSMKAEIDKKISEVLLTTDEKQRQAMYTYILKTLHDEAVYLPISYSSIITVYPKNFKGVDFRATTYDIPFDQIYF